jgi:hypothetical protein
MGRDRDLAASVPWANMMAAIQANQTRDASLGLGGAVSAVTSMPTETPALTWLSGGWTEDTSLTVPDAIALSLWIRDPLYRSAVAGVRRAMEAEEATALLNVSETAWRDHNGRVRGWVRKHLEEDLRARSGSGDPAPDFWEAVRTQRRTALLLDYVCVMRSLRVAIWWPEQKVVTVIPAATAPTITPTTPIVQLNATSGRILLGPGSTGFQVPALTWAHSVLNGAMEIQWNPPVSVPAMSSMTVAQIQEAMALLDPTAEKAGGRQVLWNRLHWLQLLAALRPSAEA